MWRVVNPTREHEVVELQPRLLDSLLHSFAGRGCDLELHRALSLVLHHRGASGHLITVADVPDLEMFAIAGAVPRRARPSRRTLPATGDRRKAVAHRRHRTHRDDLVSQARRHDQHALPTCSDRTRCRYQRLPARVVARGRTGSCRRAGASGGQPNWDEVSRSSAERLDVQARHEGHTTGRDQYQDDVWRLGRSRSNTAAASAMYRHAAMSRLLSSRPQRAQPNVSRTHSC